MTIQEFIDIMNIINHGYDYNDLQIKIKLNYKTKVLTLYKEDKNYINNKLNELYPKLNGLKNRLNRARYHNKKQKYIEDCINISEILEQINWIKSSVNFYKKILLQG